MIASPQQWLVAAITADAAPRDRRRLVSSGLAAEDGLGIYRHAYRARLEECLADDFPALRALLGESAFADLAARVITRFPPREATLNRYGRMLLRCLRSEPAAPPHGRFAHDLARLEWALVEAIHAPLAPAWDVGGLARLSPRAVARLRLRPVPSLRVVASAWAVDDVYRRHLAGLPVPPPPRAAQAVAVLRRGDGLHRHVCSAEVGRLLARLARGLPLGDALARCRLPPAAVQGALADLTAAGCFAGVHTGESHVR